MACLVHFQLSPTMHSDSAQRRSMSVIRSKPLDNLAVVRDRPLPENVKKRTNRQDVELYQARQLIWHCIWIAPLIAPPIPT
jgi:hypothetical protein